MNAVKRTLLALGLSLAAHVQAEPASETAIRALLEATQARQLVESVQGQVEKQMQDSSQALLAGRRLNAKEEAALHTMQTKMAAVMRDELSWARMERIYVTLYRETLSEEEVAGMLAFYQTPAGQAVIRKMPLMMQKVMDQMQGFMASASPKLRQIQQEFAQEMKDARKP